MSGTRVCPRAVGIGFLLLAMWGCDDATDAPSINGASSSTSLLATPPAGVPVYTVTSIDAITGCASTNPGMW